MVSYSMKKIIPLLLCVLSTSAYAVESKEAWQKTFNDGLALAKDAKTSQEMVKKMEPLIVQRFDFNLLSAYAVGQPWKTMTEEEKKLLAPQFESLLKRIYAGVLFKYKNSVINVSKTEDMGNGNGRVVTDVEASGQKYNIIYMVKSTSGKDKIYDVQVEGASIVSVYRNQFKATINNKGVKGLIDELSLKNQKQP